MQCMDFAVGVIFPKQITVAASHMEAYFANIMLCHTVLFNPVISDSELQVHLVSLHYSSLCFVIR